MSRKKSWGWWRRSSWIGSRSNPIDTFCIALQEDDPDDTLRLLADQDSWELLEASDNSMATSDDSMAALLGLQESLEDSLRRQDPLLRA